MADDRRTPFHDLDDFVALRRTAGLWLSPDGTRLVTTVAAPSADGTEFRTALWEVDPTGERPSRRLTRSAPGESAPAFLPDGSVLFVSRRPDPQRKSDSDDEPPAALWLLPAGSGEARVVADRPGGVTTVAAARDTGTVVLAGPTLPQSTTEDDERRRRATRKEQKLTAILHDGEPVRWWDHDLGPDQPRLFAADPPAEPPPAGADDGRLPLRDLTPMPGRALDECEYDVSADGSTVVTTWRAGEPRADVRSDVVAVDVATGDTRPVCSDPEFEYQQPRLAPDARSVVCLRERRSTPTEPIDVNLWLQPMDGSPGRVIAADLDLWPDQPQWSADGTAVYFVADQRGRRPVFRAEIESDSVRRLVTDSAYTDPRPSPDGRWVYALRAGCDDAGTVVRLAADAVDQEPTRLPSPLATPTLPGTLTEVEATADDGTALRSWLVLPAEASASDPSPLLVWIHGGPLSSWNTWSWRWNPWLMAARGYAVLLPDPALSTGYGLDFVRRGWGRWGGPPYADLMALTDAACARHDLDESRTAAMGGSFGGYLANWVAGHTGRFRAIVTHASLWALDQFGGTTDAPQYWYREMTAEMALANSPHRHADGISTPMLVIHGDKDYRVPIGDGLRLWWDLCSRWDDPAALPHRFLYFPDEGHWVLKPQHEKVWYETVFAFLGWHVLGGKWVAPDLV